MPQPVLTPIFLAAQHTLAGALPRGVPLAILQVAPGVAEPQSAVGAAAENIVLSLLYQLLAILAMTRIVIWMVKYLGQTDVSGEILAGLLLGPSFLQSAFSERGCKDSRTSFFPHRRPSFSRRWRKLGLILLMFQIGLEFEFLMHLGNDKKPIFVISILGIVLPFTMGYFTAPWFHARLGASDLPLFGFRLFFAVAMSITATPSSGASSCSWGYRTRALPRLRLGLPRWMTSPDGSSWERFRCW